jgi:hypothetical protein
MGLFGRKMWQCFFCSNEVEKSALLEHYETHLIEVTDNNRQRAYTFECPRCGAMDLAWGGSKPDPTSHATAAVPLHLWKRHNISLP